MKISKDSIAAMIDHTNLKAYADEEAIKKLCEEAEKYHFASVMVNGCQVKKCREYLKNSSVHVGTVIGFPLGQTTIPCKVFEVRDANLNGADEIDYVLNISEVKNGNFDFIRKEMNEIVFVSREYGVISKVIFENCYLTDQEKIEVAEIAKIVKPDFIKTSTGFGTGGATVEDVKLMKSIVGEEVKVKAAGGICDLDSALSMIQAGASRIGSSSSVKIVEAV